MENKDGKLADASKVGLGLIIDSILDVGAEESTEIIKESIPHIAGEVSVDILSSMIPGVSGAIQSYKRVRAEKNLQLFVEQLHEKHNDLIKNLQKQTEKNRKKIDQLLLYILEITIDEYQEEKIEYIVNGYLNLTTHQEFTSDFVMHYYDMLKQLRLVDLSVLKLYNQNVYMDANISYHETYVDVMDKHGISYEQYNSVKETLLRYDLLKLELKEDTNDDMNKLESEINKIVSYIEHIRKNKRTRPPKLSKVKIRQRSRERIKISKFGREFYDFFLKHN